MEDWGLDGLLSDLGGIFETVSDKYFTFEKLRLDHDLAKTQAERTKALTKKGVFDDLLSSLGPSWSNPNATVTGGGTNYQAVMFWIALAGLGIAFAAFVMRR